MRTAPLWKFAESRPSNVDKKSVANEQPVRLVNYTDVYKNPSLNTDMELMEATASDDHIARFRLQPGDVIATGTPAGVGFARSPQEYMKEGDVCEVVIERIGTLRNVVTRELEPSR